MSQKEISELNDWAHVCVWPWNNRAIFVTRVVHKLTFPDATVEEIDELSTAVNSVEVSRYNKGQQSDMYNSIIAMIEQGLVKG